MIIKVPEKIKIGTHSYTIFYKPHLSKDDGNRGTLCNRLEQIWIEPTNPISQRNVTLLHEVLHLIGLVYSLNISEDDIDRIAEGFAELLFDNLEIELDWSEVKETESDNHTS